MSLWMLGFVEMSISGRDWEQICQQPLHPDWDLLTAMTRILVKGHLNNFIPKGPKVSHTVNKMTRCVINSTDHSNYTATWLNLESELWGVFNMQHEISSLQLTTMNVCVAQIPQCTSSISHNAPFYNRNVHVWAHSCYKMVHCGISL